MTLLQRFLNMLVCDANKKNTQRVLERVFKEQAHEAWIENQRLRERKREWLRRNLQIQRDQAYRRQALRFWQEG
jgi:hypothetical protein